MTHRFLNLSQTAQKTILDSAYQVFTDTPYEQASTNTLVKNAGISKGKLFYYFKDKRTLFHYLVERALEHLQTHYIDQLTFFETDFLKRYIRVAQIEQRAYEKEPHLFAFLSYVHLHESHRLTPEMLAFIEHTQQRMKEALKEGVDVSLFREDLEPTHVMQLLEYSLKGYELDLIETFKQTKIQSVELLPHYQAFEDFIKTLRKIYYKEETV